MTPLCSVVFIVLFTAETVLKVIALSFMIDPSSYLSSSWNCVDFFIVIISWVDMIASSLRIGVLRSLRLLRAFRAIRMLNKLEGLQRLVISLMQSASALVNMLAVTLLVYLMFAIFGVNQFKGQFFRCSYADAIGRSDCVGSFVEVGVLASKSWENSSFNFDNIFNAMAMLYELSADEWVVKAHRAMDAVGVDRQPIVEH